MVLLNEWRLMIMKKRFIIWSCSILALVAGVLWLIHNRQDERQKVIVATVEETSAEKRACLFRNVKKVIVYMDEMSMLNALEEGDVDAGLTDFLTGLSAMKIGKYSNLKFTGKLIEPENIGVVFHKEDHALRQEINEGIKRIIDNGIYRLISQSYFGLDIGSKLKPTADELPEIKTGDDPRHSHSGEITVAFYENDWPFSYFNDDNELTGFSVEIAKSVCQELGIAFNPIVYPRDEILEGLKNRYFDCVWCSISAMGPENNLFCFSNPFYVSGLQLIVKRGSKIKDLE
jgi:ABC-type amino acid transport substrate-binding protein